MTEHPILFSGPMVRALLDGRKTQTRRILGDKQHKLTADLSSEEMESLETKGWNISDSDTCFGDHLFKVPVVTGDRLWVREAHRLTDDGEYECVVYEADEKDVQNHEWGIRKIQEQCGLSDEWAKPHMKKRPSIHMPRWASRLTLVVTNVRVQRLQDISDKDAVSEGIKEVSAEWPPCPKGGYEGAPYPSYADYGPNANGCFSGYGAARLSFMKLWNSLNDDSGYGWNDNPWVAAYTFTVHQENIDRMGEAA